jgi:hypothetical protein
MLEPSRPDALRLTNRVAQPLDRQRIFRAHINVPFVAPTHSRRSAMPSSTRCGSLSSTLRSMNAPGSPSSALQMTYFCVPTDFSTVLHFSPSPHRRSHFRSPRRISVALHQRSVAASSARIAPEFSNTIFFCRWKNGTSVRQTRRDTGSPRLPPEPGRTSPNSVP